MTKVVAVNKGSEVKENYKITSILPSLVNVSPLTGINKTLMILYFMLGSVLRHDPKSHNNSYTVGMTIF